MSLHPRVLADLLDNVDVTFDAQDRTWWMRLNGRDYDRLPLSLSFLGVDGVPLAASDWPVGLAYPGLHPVLKRPWACLRGTLEYHLFPGHTAGGDSWDASRADLRLADVIDHVLQRCGA